MQRRSFIGAVLAALATPLLPAADLGFKVPNPEVWNAATLTAELQKLFTSQMGPVAPLFEMLNGEVVHAEKVVLPVPGYPNQYYTDWAEPPSGATRYIYTTYACAVEGGSAQEAEARLAKHFYDQFSQLPAGPLVWRVQPQFSSEEVVEYGDVWATLEDVQDGYRKITDKPDNVEQDPLTGSYKCVTKRAQLHKMRMRLVLPHLHDHTNTTVVLPELHKADGALLTRMI